MNRGFQGFSLVEILVAMVISLLGVLIIFQVFELSEGIKRTSTGGGDAQQNGLLALVAIERDARMSGFGINYTPLLGCPVQGSDAGRNINFTLTAAVIADEVSAAGDSITFVYGNSPLLLSPPKLTTATAANAPFLKVDNRYGFNISDMIIVGEVGKTCSLAQATGLSTVVGQQDQVDRSAGNFNSTNLSAAYDAWDNTAQSGARLYSLGAIPGVMSYSVDAASGRLMVRNVVTSGVADSLAEGIVQLQAQYGKDTSATADGSVDVWDTTAPTTADGWSRILALRFAVVARGAHAEKPGSDGKCRDINDPNDPTKPLTDPTKRLKWAGGSLDVTYLTTANTDWTCYRYRVFETMVPLRNLIWIQP
ncbi:MAG TPA: PilW family protein [Burkholderiales bacterium]|jgi:type IV pilus assembly protein PilW|nr:PilW family protein [Burkholderiales bacterium]